LTGLQQQAVSLGMLATGIVALLVGLLALQLHPLLGALTALASVALLLYPAAFMPERAEVGDRCRPSNKRF
jgi:hypothetical protein